MERASISEIGYLSVNVLLSVEGSYPSCGVNNTSLQMPSAPAFHLHSNRDVWVNRQQAPNLLLGLRGQDGPERWPAAGTRGQTHQDMNCVPKSFFAGEMESALGALGIKQQYAFQFIYVCRYCEGGRDERFEVVFCVRLPNRSSFFTFGWK